MKKILLWAEISGYDRPKSNSTNLNFFYFFYDISKIMCIFTCGIVKKLAGDPKYRAGKKEGKIKKVTWCNII